MHWKIRPFIDAVADKKWSLSIWVCTILKRQTQWTEIGSEQWALRYREQQKLRDMTNTMATCNRQQFGIVEGSNLISVIRLSFCFLLFPFSSCHDLPFWLVWPISSVDNMAQNIGFFLEKATLWQNLIYRFLCAELQNGFTQFKSSFVDDNWFVLRGRI